MSKIICDVCGTSYPETATQCPICGYVNSGNNQSISGDTTNSEAGYNYVKGGRFSKANVRKRNQSKSVQPAVRNTTTAKVVKSEDREAKTTKGLVITAVVLLLAIIAVVVYISLRFFGDGGFDGFLKPNASVPATSEVTEPVGSDTVAIPCESIKLDAADVTFDKLNTSRMLYATVSPANTTDAVTFTSDNEQVVTVTPKGKMEAKLTPVGAGEATITVTCGKATAKCVVKCTAENPAETTTETTVPETSGTSEELRLNRQDITFSAAGDSWVLYNGNIGKTQITWSSDNEKIAKFEGGKVTAVGGGTTKVYAEYNGQKVSCIIRCNFSGGSSSKPGIDGNGGGISEDGGSASSGGSAKIYSQFGAPISDVTIGVGESLQLTLKDSSGKKIDTTWSLSGGSCTLSGNSVTGTKSGSCTVSTAYNGTTYSCVVRVGK